MQLIYCRWNKSRQGIELHDGAEIHWRHVLVGAIEHGLNDDPVGFFGGVEGIPERDYVSVGAQIRRRRAQSYAVIGPLSATRHL